MGGVCWKRSFRYGKAVFFVPKAGFGVGRGVFWYGKPDFDAKDRLPPEFAEGVPWQEVFSVRKSGVLGMESRISIPKTSHKDPST